MKNILIILLSALTISLSAQWNPRKGNTVKWYHVEKDTVIKGFVMSGFDVCSYGGMYKYVDVEEDSLGNVITSPIATTIWFREFASGTKNKKLNENDKLNDYAVDFNVLPFACESDGLGVNNAVNEFLSKKYNVPLSAITE